MENEENVKRFCEIIANETQLKFLDCEFCLKGGDTVQLLGFLHYDTLPVVEKVKGEKWQYQKWVKVRKEHFLIYLPYEMIKLL